MSLHELDPAGAFDEMSLVSALRAGEETAFAELVRGYGGRMLAVAKRLLRDEDEARDVVQEAFLSAFRSIGRFEGSARLSTWLHRIVVNCALMKLRSRQRKPEEPIEELMPRFLEDGHRVDHFAPGWEEPVDVLLQRKEVCFLVRRSIDRLPATYRTVLLCRDIEGLDTAEVAALLGISENAVKVRLHRARQALRELLDPHLRGVAA